MEVLPTRATAGLLIQQVRPILHSRSSQATALTAGRVEGAAQPIPCPTAHRHRTPVVTAERAMPVEEMEEGAAESDLLHHRWANMGA